MISWSILITIFIGHRCIADMQENCDTWFTYKELLSLQLLIKSKTKLPNKRTRSYRTKLQFRSVHKTGPGSECLLCDM